MRMQVAADFNRSNTFSSVLVQATDEVTAAALIKSLGQRPPTECGRHDEKDYYGANDFGGPGAVPWFFCLHHHGGWQRFAAMNTMYAAVARRAREIGTLRVLGFTKGSILLSFFLESLLLSLIGGILACVLVLPLNNITTGIGNFMTFSETSFNFRMGPEVMAVGIVLSLVLGAAGGIAAGAASGEKGDFDGTAGGVDAAEAT